MADPDETTPGPAGWPGVETAFERALDWAPQVAHRRGLDEHTVLGVWGDLLALLDPGRYAAPAETPGADPG